MTGQQLPQEDGDQQYRDIDEQALDAERAVVEIEQERYGEEGDHQRHQGGREPSVFVERVASPREDGVPERPPGQQGQGDHLQVLPDALVHRREGSGDDVAPGDVVEVMKQCPGQEHGQDAGEDRFFRGDGMVRVHNVWLSPPTGGINVCPQPMRIISL